MNLIELRERYAAAGKRLGELRPKLEDGSLTDAESDELDTVLAEFNDLGEQASRAATVTAAADRAKQATEPNGRRISGLVPTKGAEERQQIDRRSIGQRFAESDQIKDFLAGGGKSSRPLPVGGLLTRGGTVPEYHEGDGTVEQRTLIHTGVQPGYMIPDMVVPGIFRPADFALTMRDVLLSGRTTSDTIYFLRELAFTNAAVEVAEATATTGATGTKPESALTFEQASAPVVTIAHWIPVTRQMLADAAQIQSYIEGRLLVGLDRRLNGQLLNGDGTAPNMRGLFNTTGVQILNNGVSPAYWADNPVNDAGTDNENFNRVLRAKRLIDTVGDAEATFISLNPADIEQFQVRTDADRQYLAGGPFAEGGVPRLWGLRVVKERSIPAGKALVGDGRMAQVWDREDGNILIDTINDQFIRNMLTILAEMRAALTVYRPVAFANVDLATWA